MGNSRCQGDRVRLAIGRTIPSPSSTSAGCFACKQNSWARESSWHLPSMPNCTNWLVSCPATLLRKGGCRVHQQARSWLQERLAGSQFYPSPNCPIKLSCLGFQSERERNFCLPTIPIAVLQKPLICKKCSNSTLVRTFDMACYATTVLIRRIEEVSEYKKSIKKQRNLI
jgi:hypothetical protein